MAFPRASLLVLCLSFATAVQAGTVTDGAWSPASCGVKPDAPRLDLKDVDAFNASVKKVNTYRLAIRDYLNCLAKEANADIQAITKSATAVQQAAKEADEAILADVQAADKKFGK